MWVRLLVLVSIVEVAIIAILLAVVVVNPTTIEPPLTQRMRQVCALAAILLSGGAGYAGFCWLRALVRSYMGPITTALDSQAQRQRGRSS